MVNVASVLYVQLESEFSELESRYNILLQEFRKTGDDEVFIELDTDLIMLGEKAYKLSNLEERFEVIKDVSRLRGLIRSITH